MGLVSRLKSAVLSPPSSPGASASNRDPAPTWLNDPATGGTPCSPRAAGRFGSEAAAAFLSASGHAPTSGTTAASGTFSPLASLLESFDSVTVYNAGTKAETTVLERAGAKFLLQEVKLLSNGGGDDDGGFDLDDDGVQDRGSFVLQQQQQQQQQQDEAASAGGSSRRPVRRLPSRQASLPLIKPPTSSGPMHQLVSRFGAGGAGGSTSPSTAALQPTSRGTSPMASPVGSVSGPKHMSASFTTAKSVTRPFVVGPNSLSEPPSAVPAKIRRPPKKGDSLKCLLQLDRYKFNEDVDVGAAREAVSVSGPVSPRFMAMAMAPEPSPRSQGRLEDIMTGADGASILAVSQSLPAKMRRERWLLRDYTKLRQLHAGYASDVFQARCNLSGEVIALKVYKVGGMTDISKMQLYREIKLHSALRHENIVQFYACFLEKGHVMIVQEFSAGGDLLRFMCTTGGRLQERQAVKLVLQPFLRALHYLHTQGIVHRDIKPENVLFDGDNVLKIADFGLAISVIEERANTRAGTLDYMAPEVLLCPTKKTPDEGKDNSSPAPHYQYAADAWAVGIFAYELITGMLPFKEEQMAATARNIIHAPIEFPEDMSDVAVEFIKAVTRKHPADRLTVMQMLRHPWITAYQRRASMRSICVHSNSLMELVADANNNNGAAAAAAGAVSPLQ